MAGFARSGRKLAGFLCLVLAAVACFAAGWGAAWWRYVHAPRQAAVQALRREQAKLEEMLRRGTLERVDAGSVALRVEEGGGDVGRTVVLRSDAATGVQIGAAYVNRRGEAPDLAAWFRPGDRVSVLAKDGRILVIQRELREGEAPPAPGPARVPGAKEDG